MAVLMDSGLEFVARDNPYANRLTVHFMSAIAEHERRILSQRTTEALIEARIRGTHLGSSRPGHWQDREYIRTARLDVLGLVQP
jgi:DNA invertase Pin-like site-specific DNA recombinase